MLERLVFDFYKACPEQVVQNINLIKTDFYAQLDSISKTKNLPSKNIQQINDLLDTNTQALLKLSNYATLSKLAKEDDAFAKAVVKTTTERDAKPADDGQNRQLSFAQRLNNCQIAVQDAISQMRQIQVLQQDVLTNTVQSAIMVEYLDQFNDKLNELVGTANSVHAHSKKLNNSFPCYQSDCVQG